VSAEEAVRVGGVGGLPGGARTGSA